MRTRTRWGFALVVALISLLAWPPGPAAAFDHAIAELEVVQDVAGMDLTLSPELLDVATPEVVADGVCISVHRCAGAELRATAADATFDDEITAARDAYILKLPLEPPPHRRGIRGT